MLTAGLRTGVPVPGARIRRARPARRTRVTDPLGCTTGTEVPTRCPSCISHGCGDPKDLLRADEAVVTNLTRTTRVARSTVRSVDVAGGLSLFFRVRLHTGDEIVPMTACGVMSRTGVRWRGARLRDVETAFRAWGAADARGAEGHRAPMDDHRASRRDAGPVVTSGSDPAPSPSAATFGERLELAMTFGLSGRSLAPLLLSVVLVVLAVRLWQVRVEVRHDEVRSYGVTATRRIMRAEVVGIRWTGMTFGGGEVVRLVLAGGDEVGLYGTAVLRRGARGHEHPQARVEAALDHWRRTGHVPRAID